MRAHEEKVVPENERQRFFSFRVCGQAKPVLANTNSLEIDLEMDLGRENGPGKAIARQESAVDAR